MVLSLPTNVEDLLFERDIDIFHGTVRLWSNRFGPLHASIHNLFGLERHLVDRQTYRPTAPLHRIKAIHCFMS